MVVSAEAARSRSVPSFETGEEAVIIFEATAGPVPTPERSSFDGRAIAGPRVRYLQLAPNKLGGAWYYLRQHHHEEMASCAGREDAQRALVRGRRGPPRGVALIIAFAHPGPHGRHPEPCSACSFGPFTRTPTRLAQTAPVFRWEPVVDCVEHRTRRVVRYIHLCYGSPRSKT
jgi:hypothetical protein